MAGDITTIARPYAEAVYKLARETDSVESWSAALSLLATIADDPDMARQIANPTAPRERLRDLILDICGPDLPPQARNLVGLLAENARLEAISEIARLFDDLRVKQRGLRQVTVRSAYPLEAAEETRLIEVLRTHLGAEIELTVEEDPGLLGGVEIHAGDLVIDDSVRGKLQRLATQLQF
ncbi:F0F1 ATP synthase subunit delta [Thiococcus pfennigii]|jgi:F-type H+-transporting ATPase subunit delta|uniref:F0F1 ATP synthase subunit delta n=1 Tax=Thiococcus pfennigii TaxID=1057 RepID=UPI0019087A4C|nr:F0F1 ATP synthase subunit delta [Thiococcus pfennigii]MBK1701191.1 F0F1 ATP synthase subunit delta [Thiococcus pfennigii]MBK1730573.1 F0F1 ATP synthase subunit delta [Thiococcus pfennigii]